ncbi:MAG TPA: molybdopterin cofactor-binding domain-containing protein [Solirubrobacteraceae bacterium]|nr:molybdopterin cofactor-binding domain-containing protein [Solirubrobacteraceae bacterium]
MANEAYRAVFLRMHPTGKGVLSLTTSANGQEAEFAGIVSRELGIPTLDVKVVGMDTDRFGVGHTFNTSPSPTTAQAVATAAGRIRERCQLLAGMALGTAPSNLKWGDGRWYVSRDPKQGRTIEDLSLYAYGSGDLPPGIEGGLDAQAVYR